jgi:gluconolactonase
MLLCPNHADSFQRYPSRANAAALGTSSFSAINPKQTSPPGGCFLVFKDEFLDLLGPEPEIEVILENKNYPFAHEAGVLIPATDEVWITSNQYFVEGKKHIQISKIKREGSKFTCEEVNPAGVPYANGAVNYKDGVLFCAQGTPTSPGGLVYMEPRPPYKTEVILNNYLGRSFNSVNDVIIHSDGSVWFTDPVYGFEQNIRPRPILPSVVYRFDPERGDLRVMADGFGKPNGISFSPDEKTVYVTDTAAQHGGGEFDSARAATMYVASTSPFPLLIALSDLEEKICIRSCVHPQRTLSHKQTPICTCRYSYSRWYKVRFERECL